MKFALCNEVLQHLSIEDGFSKIAEIGYDGVEIAPFTLKENPLDVNKRMPKDVSRQPSQQVLKSLDFTG